jgi:hypothetical protein
MSTQTRPEGGRPDASQTRLYRTVAMLAEALERRRRKLAAGVPVEPFVQCPCAACAYEKPSQANEHGM